MGDIRFFGEHLHVLNQQYRETIPISPGNSLDTWKHTGVHSLESTQQSNQDSPLISTMHSTSSLACLLGSLSIYGMLTAVAIASARNVWQLDGQRVEWEVTNQH